MMTYNPEDARRAAMDAMTTEEWTVQSHRVRWDRIAALLTDEALAREAELKPSRLVDVSRLACQAELDRRKER